MADISAPWTADPDLTIRDAAKRCVCIIGDPFKEVSDRDDVNKARILALPALLAAAHAVREIRPGNWDDADDAEALAAWTALDAALVAAGCAP